MALVPQAIRLIGSIPMLSDADILCFGYPDLLIDRAGCEQALGLTAGSLKQTSPHGASHKLGTEIADTREAFRATGASVEYLDLFPSRGAEHAADLGVPLPAKYREAFDIVIDAGTCEHIANVWQAVMNAASSVRVGGRVIHAPPLTMANHGMWSFQPTFLISAYEQNGWQVEHLSMHSKSWPYRDLGPAPKHARFSPPDGALLLFMARRIDGARSDLRPPTQEKYR